MIRLADESGNVAEITMGVFGEDGLEEEGFEFKFFNAESLPYSAEKDAYMVDNAMECQNKSCEWEMESDSNAVLCEVIERSLAGMVCEFMDMADPFGYRDLCSDIAPESPEGYVAKALESPDYREQIREMLDENEEFFPEEAEAIREVMGEVYPNPTTQAWVAAYDIFVESGYESAVAYLKEQALAGFIGKADAEMLAEDLREI